MGKLRCFHGDLNVQNITLVFDLYLCVMTLDSSGPTADVSLVGESIPTLRGFGVAEIRGFFFWDTSVVFQTCIHQVSVC